MHADPVRPSTPSFRIVSTPAVNPSPTFSDAFEEEEVLFEDVLSPKKLVGACNYFHHILFIVCFVSDLS